MPSKTANRYSQGQDNKFSPQSNPYSETGRRRTRPSSTEPEVPTMQAERDPAPEQDEQQTKTGFLHAVAGLNPASTDDVMYMIGYDEGTVMRAQHLAGQASEVMWLPLGPRGVRAVGSFGHEAVVVPDRIGWQWWITDRQGMEVVAGRATDIDAANREVEARLASLASGVSLSTVLADVMYTNPHLPARQALRIATAAHRLATGTE